MHHTIKCKRKSIISETKENSRIQVSLATSALEMGVNAPYVHSTLYTCPQQVSLKLGVLEKTGIPKIHSTTTRLTSLVTRNTYKNQ